MTRAIAALPAPLNQGRQRGQGFWVRGDGKGELLFVELVSRGCKRQYYVPVDFTGERYFEFPLGEMCLGRYYAYDWNHWSGFASWWVTLKGFDYGRVDQVTIGFNRIPAGQEVSCAVAGLRALKELGAGLRNPAVELAGRRMVFQDTLPAGSYLVYPSPAHRAGRRRPPAPAGGQEHPQRLLRGRGRPGALVTLGGRVPRPRRRGTHAVNGQGIHPQISQISQIGKPKSA